MWDSVQRHVFAAPDETLLFSGHSRTARVVSTVKAQRLNHPWFAQGNRQAFLVRARGGDGGVVVVGSRRAPAASTLMGRHVVGGVLVALQFGLLSGLGLLAMRSVLAGLAPAGAWLVLLSGLALGTWAMSCNRPGNFNIRPAPRVGGRLVQSGPYRWIRHPMYSAVLLVASACAWAATVAVAWLGVGLLVVMLLIKAALEERWMLAQHAGYAQYRDRTKKFVPGLF